MRISKLACLSLICTVLTLATCIRLGIRNTTLSGKPVTPLEITQEAAVPVRLKPVQAGPAFKPGDYVCCLDQHYGLVVKIIRVITPHKGPPFWYELEVPDCRCELCTRGPVWESEANLEKAFKPETAE